jgi:K+-sensing histidine kinase KdpD
MKKEFGKFIKEIDNKDIDIHCDYILASDKDLGKQIYKYARDRNNDLILLGSGTKTLLESYFSKNVVKKVTEYDYDIPVLIVKGAKNYIDLWKSILKKHKDSLNKRGPGWLNNSNLRLYWLNSLNYLTL